MRVPGAIGCTPPPGCTPAPVSVPPGVPGVEGTVCPGAALFGVALLGVPLLAVPLPLFGVALLPGVAGAGALLAGMLFWGSGRLTGEIFSVVRFADCVPFKLLHPAMNRWAIFILSA